MDFSVTKKGYSPAEVEEYITAVKREYESTIIKQRDRIKDLLDEKQAADRELKAYREKSNQISKAIVSAVAKAEEIERLSHLKYSQEITRLKAFHEKWTKYYDKILDEYPLDSKLAAVGEFNRRMDKILSRVGCEDDAAATAEKSEPIGEFDPMERINNYFASAPKPPAPEKTVAATVNERPKKDYADRSPSGFSFEEALNPTEDLEDILKDLGLFSCD